ncbi:hypothetical protein BDF20DRAFT_833653 [Mycotypha africana]|uniref:uncharacterized protein n=1 Tax=Mycotypha africana TaxID=64632 RepID=UPI002300437A|nr:uncharacterized protein BDF20DRAFT_833653 [Mycotypha africana]KAI8984122.1 hypothetical protein BDF20DRAFT_833653 [Mycotypha africana]
MEVKYELNEIKQLLQAQQLQQPAASNDLPLLGRVSREQSICLFYAVQYNKENAEKYTKKIDEMEDVDVCYTKNQKRPRLLCTRIIYANSFDIHLYPSGSRQEKADEEVGQSNEEVGNRKLEIEDSFSKFTNWCRTQKLNFTTTSVKRKHEDSSPTSRSTLRNLYVLGPV